MSPVLMVVVSSIKKLTYYLTLALTTFNFYYICLSFFFLSLRRVCLLFFLFRLRCVCSIVTYCGFLVHAKGHWSVWGSDIFSIIYELKLFDIHAIFCATSLLIVCRGNTGWHFVVHLKAPLWPSTMCNSTTSASMFSAAISAFLLLTITWLVAQKV